MKCPVCCENFSGERCPHCGMRISGSQQPLFSGEDAGPVVRNGKVSLAALERRQESGRRTRRVLLTIVGVFVVIVLLGFLPLLLNTASPVPEPVRAEDQADAWITNLELDLEQWAQDSGKNAIFFYMEDPECINGVLDQEGLLHLAEQAAAGDTDALAAWYEAEDLCRNFYDECRVQLDDMGQAELPLTAWLADADSGELLLGVDLYDIWYSYYDELLNEPVE